MQHVSEVLFKEHFLDCSKSFIIDCQCGEKLLLLGRESDWCKEGRVVFECGGCGKELSLEDAHEQKVQRGLRRLSPVRK
jgi:DNA-directed RNA polymerase subunit RPC12/RpoP